jgi:hypothetical protein
MAEKEPILTPEEIAPAEVTDQSSEIIPAPVYLTRKTTIKVMAAAGGAVVAWGLPNMHNVDLQEVAYASADPLGSSQENTNQGNNGNHKGPDKPHHKG